MTSSIFLTFPFIFQMNKNIFFFLQIAKHTGLASKFHIKEIRYCDLVLNVSSYFIADLVLFVIKVNKIK